MKRLCTTTLAKGSKYKFCSHLELWCILWVIQTCLQQIGGSAKAHYFLLNSHESNARAGEFVFRWRIWFLIIFLLSPTAADVFFCRGSTRTIRLENGERKCVKYYSFFTQRSCGGIIEWIKPSWPSCADPTWNDSLPNPKSSHPFLLDKYSTTSELQLLMIEKCKNRF